MGCRGRRGGGWGQNVQVGQSVISFSSLSCSKTSARMPPYRLYKTAILNLNRFVSNDVNDGNSCCLQAMYLTNIKKDKFAIVVTIAWLDSYYYLNNQI